MKIERVDKRAARARLPVGLIRAYLDHRVLNAHLERVSDLVRVLDPR